MVNNSQPSDDFFSLLEKEQKENNPTSLDEIIFRDQAGKMKVLKDGQVFDYVQKELPKPLTEKKVKDIVEPPASKPLEIIENDQEYKKKIFSEIKPKSLPEIKLSENKKAEEKISRAPLEVNRLIKPSLPQMPPRPKRQIILSPAHSVADFTEAAQEIIKKVNLSLSDTDLNKRLLNVIISNLKNIRDRIETKEMLLSSPLEGGVGLTQDVVDKIIDLSEEKRASFSQIKPRGSDVPVSLQAEVEMMLEKPTETKQVPEKKVLSLPQEKPKPPEPKLAMPAIVSVLPKNDEKKPTIKEKIVLPVIEKKQAITPVVSEKQAVKTEPIKFKPKLLDPVEEIRTMTIKDFRLLDPDPVKAADKIMKKIELLEEESIVQKVNGIKAWKESEPYKLYLKIGLQAMEEKCLMSEIIAKYQAANQETLSEAELEAIMELSQKIRY